MRIIFLLLIASATSIGCSEKGINPCNLLTLEEVQRVAPGARSHEYHPAATSKNKDNELCVWSDGGTRNVFMLFYYHARYSSPGELVIQGMPTGSRVIEISGVGDAAAAGFGDDASGGNGSLKLFAAQADENTIGIRLRGIAGENSEGFEVLKEIANTVLNRL